MATFNLRCRGPSGQVTLSGLSPDMPVSEFLQLLEEKAGVPPAAAEVLASFPPQPLQLPSDPAAAKLSDLGLANGDTFTLRRSAAAAQPPTAAPPTTTAAPTAATATSAASSGPGPAAGVATSAPPASFGDYPGAQDEDQELARALAASLADVRPPHTSHTSHASAPSGNGATPRGQSHACPAGSTPAPSFVQLPDGSCVTRRIIDSDNSCLFNAVGYVMEATRSKSSELRSVIARTVAADPVTYNDGFLGMENEAYCSWITKPDKWGGAIELSILCRHYQREIAAYDIRTQRCDVYGEGSGYGERVMLIYDGLHYDALAVAAFENAPEELDATIFNPNSNDGQAILRGAVKLVEGAHKARQFTDTANFTLRCGICQIGIKGEKEAVQHAKETGHSNFAEY